MNLQLIKSTLRRGGRVSREGSKGGKTVYVYPARFVMVIVVKKAHLRVAQVFTTPMARS